MAGRKEKESQHPSHLSALRFAEKKVTKYPAPKYALSQCTPRDNLRRLFGCTQSSTTRATDRWSGQSSSTCLTYKTVLLLTLSERAQGEWRPQGEE
ncbi:hypothetical protein FKM82_011454 [Ascaphus truei]